MVLDGTVSVVSEWFLYCQFEYLDSLTNDLYSFHDLNIYFPHSGSWVG
jgi:hypothetical protein